MVLHIPAVTLYHESWSPVLFPVLLDGKARLSYLFFGPSSFSLRIFLHVLVTEKQGRLDEIPKNVSRPDSPTSPPSPADDFEPHNMVMEGGVVVGQPVLTSIEVVGNPVNEENKA
mmetsp:Transcript_8429/g.21854  ORF Transcript_8429/g.21854 Transcript_8429/m.21854 type:complete len:115 (+) Transcript_8429:1192-1536(+)